MNKELEELLKRYQRLYYELQGANIRLTGEPKDEIERIHQKTKRKILETIEEQQNKRGIGSQKRVGAGGAECLEDKVKEVFLDVKEEKEIPE